MDGNFGHGMGRVVGPRNVRIGFPDPIQGGIVIDRLGRIIVVGAWADPCSKGSSNVEWAVVRYLQDGTPDETFGSGGVLRITALSTEAGARSVALQPDGKLVIAGGAKPRKSRYDMPVVVRLTEAGQLDATFGTGGIAWLQSADFDMGYLDALVVQASGRLLLAGAIRSDYYWHGYLIRLSPNGAVDPTFNAGGGRYVYFGRDSRFNAIRTQLVATEERIVVGGTSKDPADTYHTLATVWRFTSAGVPDATFGELVDPYDPAAGRLGITRTCFSHAGTTGYRTDYFYDVLIDSLNRIVAAGYASVDPSAPPSYGLALARLDVAGGLDQTFGNGGRLVPVDEQTRTVATSLALQEDGRIVAGGYGYDVDYINHMARVWRFLPDGSPDLTFAGTGSAADPVISSPRGVYSGFVAMQPDGKLLWAGTVSTNTSPTIMYATVARFWQ